MAVKVARKRAKRMALKPSKGRRSETFSQFSQAS